MAVIRVVPILTLVVFALAGCSKGADSPSAADSTVKPVSKGSANDTAATNAASDEKDAAAPNGMPGGGPKGGK